MAKPDRPVRVEYFGIVRGGVQVLELRITTPRGQIVNAWEVGYLPPADESEKRSSAQEGFARAALCIDQRKAIGHALAVLRSHLAGVRYIRAVERLSADMLPRTKASVEAERVQAAELEAVRKAR